MVTLRGQSEAEEEARARDPEYQPQEHGFQPSAERNLDRGLEQKNDRSDL